MPNEEPSVLDYLKSKLKFWESGGKVEIPPEAGSKRPAPVEEKPAAGPARRRVQPPSTVEIRRSKLAAIEPDEVPQPQPEAVPIVFKPLPWRSLAALVLALVAQSFLEPPEPHASIGIYLYLLAAAFLVWGVVRKEWSLAPLPEDRESGETFRVRLVPLILAFVLVVAAFVKLSDNLFTGLNLTLWVLAMACFVWAFWLPDPQAAPLGKRLRDFFARRSWPVTITGWTLLVVAVTALVLFFRLYRLGSVPSDPFSDHAEKILDVFDVTRGQTHIFFPRNTGREAIQMYLTVVVAWIFHTGLTFLSLKLDTIICGLLTLPYIFLLGKEFGGKRVGLLAVLFTGIAYWPNVIDRVGLRFDLYPLFAAPTLYYLIRGLRLRRRNDFILSGLFLGFSLHGYTSSRIMPLVVVVAVALYLLHAQSKEGRSQAVIWLGLLALTSLVVFLPLLHYATLDDPAMFSYRVASRLGTAGEPLPGPAGQIFLSNTWNALTSFNWKNGTIWVHSVVNRPALDVVSAALFLLGVLLVLFRYLFQRRHWLDLFLLLSVFLLELPSILSLAFPAENPSLNRPSAAIIPVFLLVAIALDGLFSELRARVWRFGGPALMWSVALVLVVWSSVNNFNLVFRDYANQYKQNAWNTTEMGAVLKSFDQVIGKTGGVWIVPYPYWVDTRLPAIYMGIPNGDLAIQPQDLGATVNVTGAKVFLVNTEDAADTQVLQQLYPQGVLSTHHSSSSVAGRDFLIFFVPPAQ